MKPQTERELIELILAVTAGDATPRQCERLSQLIADDDQAAQFAAKALHQEAWLSRRPNQYALQRLATQAPQAKPSAARDRVKEKPLSPGNSVINSALAPPFAGAFLWLSTAAALLMMVGALAGGAAAWWLMRGGDIPGPTLASARDASEAGPFREQVYLAKFVQGTGCIWEPGSQPPSLSSSLVRAGESFNLMEGLAEIGLRLPADGSAALVMEGPARMILKAEGIPSLIQGKFTADVHSHAGSVVLEMPFGRIGVNEESSLGVAVHGLVVEVHVFSGGATITCPWLPEQDNDATFYVNAGESVKFYVVREQTVVEQAAANPAEFATQTSMAEDNLTVSSAYVEEVMKTAPFLYWRFDDIQQGIVPNHVADRYHGEIEGSVATPMLGENQIIEFGAGLPEEALHGYVRASDPISGEITDSYSIELWMKPSHYHLGSLVSLYSATNPSSHGVLVEMGGTRATPSSIEHAGQVRFLHRDPPADDLAKGTSCFSKEHYQLRRWNHVVAVKDGGEMRLFVNGRLTATAADDTGLAQGLVMTIAQLDPGRHSRAFIGQMDELAIYSRALTSEEIQRHYVLLRPAKPSLALPSS